MPVVTLTKANSVAYDTEIRQDGPSTNYARNTAISVGTLSNGNIIRLQMFFDLGLIPNDAIINSAILTLYQNPASAAIRNYDVHPLNAPWVDTTPTWNSPTPYNSSKKVTSSIGTAVGNVSIDVKQLVQDMMNGAYANNGFLIKDSNESVVNSAKSFNSLDYTSNQPTLTIDYTIPTTGKKQAEYVGVGAFSNSTTTSISMPNPIGVQNGDLLVAHLIGTASVTFTTPSGWVKQVDLLDSSTRVIVATKFKTSADAGPFTFTASSAAGMTGRIHAFRNVKDINNKAGSATGLTSYYAPPGVTASVDNALSVLLNASSGSSVSFAPPLNYDEKDDTASASSSGGNLQISQRYLY